MIPNYVQIDMVIVSINTGNHTISLNKHTIGLEIYNSTRQYTFRPMCSIECLSRENQLMSKRNDIPLLIKALHGKEVS